MDAALLQHAVASTCIACCEMQHQNEAMSVSYVLNHINSAEGSTTYLSYDVPGCSSHEQLGRYFC